MFRSAVPAQLNLSEADILKRCRKAVMRANNPKLDIYAGGGLQAHSDAKRHLRVADASAFNAGNADPDQLARLQRQTAIGQRRSDCLSVARCVAAKSCIEDTEWASLEPALISAMCSRIVQQGIADAQVRQRLQRCLDLGMSWNFLSASALESIVHTLLTTTSFASHSLPAPLLEMRATFAYYVGFGCQQGQKREQEHFRQLIEQRNKDGRVVSQPALRHLDGTLLEISDLTMLGFQVCILHEDLLAVNCRLIETGVHRSVFEGPENNNRLFAHQGAGDYYNKPEVIQKHADEGRVSEVFLTYAPLANLIGKVRFNSNLPLAADCYTIIENHECALHAPNMRINSLNTALA